MQCGYCSPGKGRGRTNEEPHASTYAQGRGVKNGLLHYAVLVLIIDLATIEVYLFWAKTVCE